MDYPKVERNIQYSDHSSLNTLQICLPRAISPQDTSRLWLLYIHGGAWRDPAIDAASFDALQDLLLRHSSVESIAGYASINYRLSAYSSHKTDPSNPADPSRNARHPDHINDVLAAILYLQEKYHFDDRYILVGHSCGATLALQVAMKRYWGKQYESTYAEELNVVPPVAIIAVEGIYDIPELLAKNVHEPAYLDFITSAFGNDSVVWSDVSPTRGDFDSSWQDGKHLSLVHSVDDELVGTDQPALMKQTLLQQGWSVGGAGNRRLNFQMIKHLQHDELWQKPAVLAAIVDRIVLSLDSSSPRDALV